jgi:hypothetical protein
MKKYLTRLAGTPERRERVADAVTFAFCGLGLVLLTSGALTKGGEEPAREPHRVQIDCTTGRLVDVLRSGSDYGTGCFVEQP